MATRRPRRVVLGVSGSIAAYKACLIVRGLVEAGAEVRCVMTPNAAKFVSPLTLAALSRGPVCSDLLDPALWQMAHLQLASWASRVLVAPASADTLSRLAAGGASCPVSAVVLSAQVPVAVAPAMDAEMWAHKATQANVERLRGYGYEVWGPVKGKLASGRVGMGRMMEPAELVRRTLA